MGTCRSSLRRAPKRSPSRHNCRCLRHVFAVVDIAASTLIGGAAVVVTVGHVVIVARWPENQAQRKTAGRAIPHADAFAFVRVRVCFRIRTASFIFFANLAVTSED